MFLFIFRTGLRLGQYVLPRLPVPDVAYTGPSVPLLGINVSLLFEHKILERTNSATFGTAALLSSCLVAQGWSSKLTAHYVVETLGCDVTLASYKASLTKQDCFFEDIVLASTSVSFHSTIGGENLKYRQYWFRSLVDAAEVEDEGCVGYAGEICGRMTDLENTAYIFA